MTSLNQVRNEYIEGKLGIRDIGFSGYRKIEKKRFRYNGKTVKVYSKKRRRSHNQQDQTV